MCHTPPSYPPSHSSYPSGATLVLLGNSGLRVVGDCKPELRFQGGEDVMHGESGHTLSLILPGVGLLAVPPSSTADPRGSFRLVTRLVVDPIRRRSCGVADTRLM